MKRNHSNAFTLVELLVVVAIIALLLGILLPALGRARDVANRTVCAANLKQMHLAMSTYATDYKNMYPSSNDPNLSGRHVSMSAGGNLGGGRFNGNGFGKLLTLDYIGSGSQSGVKASKVFFCPGERGYPRDEINKVKEQQSGLATMFLADYTYRIGYAPALGSSTDAWKQAIPAAEAAFRGLVLEGITVTASGTSGKWFSDTHEGAGRNAVRGHGGVEFIQIDTPNWWEIPSYGWFTFESVFWTYVDEGSKGMKYMHKWEFAPTDDPGF